MTTIARRMARKAEVYRPLVRAYATATATHAAFTWICYIASQRWTTAHTIYFAGALLALWLLVWIAAGAGVESARRRAISEVLSASRFAASDD